MPQEPLLLVCLSVVQLTENQSWPRRDLHLCDAGTRTLLDGKLASLRVQNGLVHEKVYHITIGDDRPSRALGVGYFSQIVLLTWILLANPAIPHFLQLRSWSDQACFGRNRSQGVPGQEHVIPARIGRGSVVQPSELSLLLVRSPSSLRVCVCVLCACLCLSFCRVPRMSRVWLSFSRDRLLRVRFRWRTQTFKTRPPQDLNESRACPLHLSSSRMPDYDGEAGQLLVLHLFSDGCQKLAR